MDAPGLLRFVAADIKQRHENGGEIYNGLPDVFVRDVALVCAWAPAETRRALLAGIVDATNPYGLVPPQIEVLAETRRKAEGLIDAVEALEGGTAAEDSLVAAARTVVASMDDGPSWDYYPDRDVWQPEKSAMESQARQLFAAQPVGVRQKLFDEWTTSYADPHGNSYDRTGVLLDAGGVSNAVFLARVGGFFHMFFQPWSEAMIRAGDDTPMALATWRRMRVEQYEYDAYKDRWPALNPGERWADRAIAEIGEDPRWRALLTHCVPGRDQAKPGGPWFKRARTLLDAVGPEAFAARFDGWLPLVGLPRQHPLRTHAPDNYFAFRDCHPRQLDRYNVGLLSALLWMRTLCGPSPDAVRDIATIAERAAQKIPGFGPASPKLANAAVAVLVATEHPAAVAQLARLASRLTYKSTLRIVEKGLTAKAEALGVSREDVEEMALPTFGLPLTGKAGDYSYEVEIHGVDAVAVWRNAAGKIVKTAPRVEEATELKAAVKDIAATLLATRDRLDGLLRRDRRWTVAPWRERLLDHPLASTLARRLIWTVDGVACAWAGDTVRTVDDTVLDLKEDATVRLWHPIGEDVPGWRTFLARHGITQPFKQAHREQYPLTDAERATATYSNRFAAHIVRQHHLNGLLARRGWHYVQQRDDAYHHEPPSLQLPDHELRAELTVNGLQGRTDGDWMVFDTMSTDQVRFVGPDGVVELERIPPIVLSEVMRDVDLFVAAAGIGNDPNWYDGGPNGHYRDYWRRTLHDDLALTAKTRRDVLAELIPRLAVADRCTVTKKFVEVRGDLHTYRVHCGSGNILIAPDDRYLCVIPDSAKPKEPDLVLPFEGDTRLSEILSKVLLLAADKKIKDPIILRQL